MAVSSIELAATITASTTVVVAVLSGIAAYLATKRESRRKLYGEAVKAITAWGELPFRVRKRSKDQERELIDRFHSAQEEISYYRAWIGSDSKYMKRSYDQLVFKVKEVTATPLNNAWDDKPRKIPGKALSDDTPIKLDTHIDFFLRDVRSHLSLWPWRKLALICRNRKQVHGS